MAFEALVIRMNFEKTKSMARKLERIGNRLNSISNNKLDNTLGTVSNNWRGDNANVFLGKGKQMQEDLISTSSNIKATAEVIENIARNTYDAEMKALEIARARKYGG